MSRKKNRKRWKSVDKMRIVLTGMDAGVEISELCRREGVHPTQYYTWKKQLESNAGKVVEGSPEKPGRREQRLEEENARPKAVIAEITSENLELQKSVLGLEDHGQLLAGLQERVHEEVAKTKGRSGWSVNRTLRALGVSRSSYYRWLREKAWTQEKKDPVRPVQMFEALPEERRAVRG